MTEDEVRRIAREAINDRQLDDDWLGSMGAEAYALVEAMLEVLVAKFGADFADAVAASLANNLDKLRATGVAENLDVANAVETSDLRDMLD